MDKIDKNFAVSTNIERDGLKFYNAEAEPFKIYGIFKENGRFRRVPEAVAKNVSDGVGVLSTFTAGGRVRFKTDSPYIAISVEMDEVDKFSHSSFVGCAGFDLYIRKDGRDRYAGTFIPPFNTKEAFESVIDVGKVEAREITINFPRYGSVKNLYIGLKEGSLVEEPAPYKNPKPIVYYGSSITQGGCASRPGTSYQGIISRKFDCDYVNLGFSGNAKAEDEIADYIKGLDMSLFVYDYDHNAPDIEHLKNTHERMFKTVRNANPDLPIIIMPRPKYYLTEAEEKRHNIIKTTYQNAVANGDKNVYFIDGKTLMQLCEDEGTVDDCHPNDFGFASMAKAVGDVIEKIKIFNK